MRGSDIVGGIDLVGNSIFSSNALGVTCLLDVNLDAKLLADFASLVAALSDNVTDALSRHFNRSYAQL